MIASMGPISLEPAIYWQWSWKLYQTLVRFLQIFKYEIYSKRSGTNVDDIITTSLIVPLGCSRPLHKVAFTNACFKKNSGSSKLQPYSPAEERKRATSGTMSHVDVNPFGGRKHRLRSLSLQLRQHASLWWDWEKMKKLMKAKFLLENHRQEAILDYHYLSQQNMAVEEVINQFDKLPMRCDVVEEEKQVVARFLGVPQPEIADIVSLQPYWTYTDVCKLALKVEKQIKAKSKGSTSRFTPPTRTAPPTAPKTAPKATTPTTSAAGNTRERVDNSPRCYKCGGFGHYARDCPNLKTLAFVPDDAGPIYDTDAEPEVDEPGDELVYPDRGEALVIQRVLNVVVSKSVDDNSWLRNNIFRTKCTSKGKICDMIIDGGSCENVVSTYMVEKLGMKTEDHPEPYQLTWLKKGNTVKENKHAGSKHLSFKKDGVNITLVPFDSRQSQTESSNLFIKKTGFEGLLKTSPYVFTIVVVEENEIISEAPLQVHPLLREFADVIPNDIPLDYRL
ncbi:reverse transcriptase domain-containing protein [Tanacetum coccineum]